MSRIVSPSELIYRSSKGTHSLVRVSREIFPTADLSTVEVRSSTSNMTVKTLVEYLDSQIIVIDEFSQRRYLWSDVVASQFIESLIYELPVPPVFLVRREDKYYVLDGLQRLITIWRFAHNMLRLMYTVDKTLRGRTYEQLPARLRIKFDNYKMPVVEVEILNADEKTWIEIVYEIFRRLNMTPVKLSFTDILLCTGHTIYKCVHNARVIAREWDVLHKVFSFKEDEMRKLKDAVTALNLLLTVAMKRPFCISWYAYTKLRHLREALVLADEKLHDHEKRLRELLERAAAYGIDREVFVKYTYDIRSDKLAQELITIVFSVLDKIDRAITKQEIVACLKKRKDKIRVLLDAKTPTSRKEEIATKLRDELVEELRR
jgi:hypothetical protein